MGDELQLAGFISLAGCDCLPGGMRLSPWRDALVALAGRAHFPVKIMLIESLVTMEPLERVAELRQEADLVMQQVRLHDILRPYGAVVPTGSYFLDVMVYPDIDLYLSKVSIEQLFEIGGQLAQSDRVIQVVFEKSNDPQLPGGLYLKPRIAYGEWGRPWKIDIWSLDDDVIEQQMQPVWHFKARMTAELREQILRYKLSIMTQSNRPPMNSGYFIYKAFIDEGLTDFQQVTEYLIANGIRMEPG